VNPSLAPIPVESFVAEYVTAFCGQAERCQNQAPYLVAQCKEERKVVLGDVEAAVRAGRIEYDAHAAGRCVQGVAGTDCMADIYSDETLSDCFSALKGKVETGGECYSLYECGAGFCDSATTGACPSTCPQTLGEGESCALHFGLGCDLRAGLICSGGECVKPAGLKQPCVDNNGCQTGLICTTTGEGTPSLCRPLHKRDGQCSSDATCAPGLYCNGDDEGGVCKPRITEGGACGAGSYTIDAALRGVQCADGLVCRGAGLTKLGEIIAGKCARTAVEGETCLVEGTDTQVLASGCQTGLICPEGTCVLPPAEGPCALHGTCQSGVAYCDSNQTCTTLKPRGDACQFDIECQGGLCLGSACQDMINACAAP
jgi:hypothetical protein